MKNILLTGATGFIGSHLVKTLAKENFRILALVRKQSDTRLLKELNIELVEAALDNEQELTTAFEKLNNQKIQFNLVVHCAAITKGKNLDDFMHINQGGTEQLIQLIKKYNHPIQKFIFLSSLAANGPTHFNQQISLEDLAPITDYGRSKLAAEKSLQKSGLPYLIFRPTAVYGPGEKDIFSVFKIISQGLNPLIGKHQQQLTFIYVKDLVNLILQGLHSSLVNKTFFASDGKVYDKQALGNYISQSLQKKVRTIKIPLWCVRILAYGSQAVFSLRNRLSPLNPEKLKELKAQSWVCEVEPTFNAFNFRPEYDLQKGVKETSAWYVKEGWI